MYASLPGHYPLLIRSVLTATWVAAALGGASAIVHSPLTIVNELGLIFTLGWGAVITIGGCVAAVGVALDTYRLEWSAAWFTAAGLSIYGATLWWLVSTGETTRLTQAFIVTTAILFMVSRALFCGGHAARLRVLHSGQTGDIDVPR